VKNEEGVILYAKSKDGTAFTTPIRVPTFGTPKASHPQVAIDGSGQLFIGWDEFRSGARNAGLVPVNILKGVVTFGAAESLGTATSYPVMAAADRGLVAAWTSGTPDRSVINVRRIK
jgi:hypothetical protein